jgi:Zn-dependent protease with chaperone function
VIASVELAVTLAALLAAPHLLPQARLNATTGIALWTMALLLRAVISISLVVIVVAVVPATEVFTLLTHWCVHAVLPFLATHLGLDGHLVGAAALVVPVVVLTTSLLSVGFAVWRGTRRIRRWLRRSEVGRGPGASVIVQGSEVLVAAAGLRRPRVIISAGALLKFDDAELAAGLEHEWGHVRRWHRFIALLGELCLALSRLLPGGRRALAGLRLHLERDADDYAVRRTQDPLALASAICKAAESTAPVPGPSLASLAGTGETERVRRLIEPGERSPLLAMYTVGLAAVMAVASFWIAGALPALASASPTPNPAQMIDCA